MGGLSVIPTQNETAPFVLVGANEQPGVPLIGKDRAFAALEVLQDTLVNPASTFPDSFDEYSPSAPNVMLFVLLSIRLG